MHNMLNYQEMLKTQNVKKKFGPMATVNSKYPPG